MAGSRKRWLRPALLGWAPLCGLVVGPLFLFHGIRAIGRGGPWLDTVGGWLMALGGGVALISGLVVLVLVRRGPPE